MILRAVYESSMTQRDKKFSCRNYFEKLQCRWLGVICVQNEEYKDKCFYLNKFSFVHNVRVLGNIKVKH